MTKSVNIKSVKIIKFPLILPILPILLIPRNNIDFIQVLYYRLMLHMNHPP